jgi:hypothetical protein
MFSDTVVRVIPFSADECPRSPTSGPPLFTWREFYGFRNAVLAVLRNYGTVGPMGELPIRLTWKWSKSAWEAGARNPDFFVVADMWNRWNRWHRVESAPRFVNTSLLNELASMVKAYPGWCVYLALQIGWPDSIRRPHSFRGGPLLWIRIHY